MNRIFTLIALFLTTTAFSQTVDITFTVNMETQIVDDGGVYLVGGTLFGAPGTNEMLDPDGDGTYSITMTLAINDSSYYAFANGNCPDFSCKEGLGGQPCAFPENFNDRWLPPVTEDQTIMHCYEQCTTDGTCADVGLPQDVTFRLDMSNETVAGSVYITGNVVDNWCGTCVEMLDEDNDDVYEVTINMSPGFSEYKYNNGGWDGTENLDPTGTNECTLTSGTYTNRTVVVEGNSPVVMDVVCFNSCDACPTSLSEMSIDGFSMSPTMTNGLTYLNFTQAHQAGRQIDLYNTSMQKVLSQTIGGTETRHQLDLSALASGLYMLHLNADGAQTIVKVVVTK